MSGGLRPPLQGGVKMWVFTDKGFLSIVQHNRIEDCFQVKSRVIEPLEILWPEHEIEIIDWADYRFRITIPKAQVIPVLAEQVGSVGYTSFKNECENDLDYYHALTRVWSIMYNYQAIMGGDC